MNELIDRKLSRLKEIERIIKDMAATPTYWKLIGEKRALLGFIDELKLVESYEL